MSLDSWLLNPLSVIEETFERRTENGDWIDNVKTFFKEEISNDEIYKKIPYLNKFSLSEIKENQVVKFRGMVQDILNPEYYLQSYEVIDNNGDRTLKPGAYKEQLLCPENAAIDFDSQNAVTGDRKVYCLIPIPGENRWVKELLDTSFLRDISMQDLSLKRQIGELEELDESQVNKEKRTANGTEDTDMAQGQSNSSENYKHTLFPFEDSNNVSCLAKVYEDFELKLNDVVEVIGIVHLPTKSVTPTEEYLTVAESISENLKASEIRIHSLYTRKLQHYNPLIDIDIHKDMFSKEWMRESRELLRGVLQEALLGDSLAAEYMILHLVSSVYMRQDVLALGCFSLNLIGINESLQKQEFARRFYSLIQSITTHSSYLPMTIDNINNLPFSPKKDYKLERLCSGVLQLPANNHFVLDETKLSDGQLSSKGIQNITSLGNLINWQKVEMDFKYYTLDQPSNVSVLVLSEGKSISDSNCRLKFNPSHCDVRAGFKQLQSQLTEENLKAIRTYLTVARLLPYILSDEMKKLVEDHFVNSRQSSSKYSVDDLHQLITMGRLVSISCGESEMTPDTWKSAQILVKEKNNREKNVI